MAAHRQSKSTRPHRPKIFMAVEGKVLRVFAQTAVGLRPVEAELSLSLVENCSIDGTLKSLHWCETDLASAYMEGHKAALRNTGGHVRIVDLSRECGPLKGGAA